MISETKIDSSFPKGQFLIEGYNSQFRFDRNKNGGGIILYVREDIPVTLKLVECSPIEGFFIEIVLNKKKWLISCSYNPNIQNIENHILTY